MSHSWIVGSSALEDHRLVELPDLVRSGSSACSAPDLDDVGVPGHKVDVPRVHELGGHGEPGPVAGLARYFNPPPQPWKRTEVRGLNARRAGTCPAEATRSRAHIMSRPSTEQGPRTGREPFPRSSCRHRDDGVLFPEFPADELERARIRSTFSTTGSPRTRPRRASARRRSPDDRALHPREMCASAVPLDRFLDLPDVLFVAPAPVR